MSEAMAQFIEEVREIVREGGTEEEMTSKVAEVMEGLLDLPDLFNPEHLRITKGSYVLHPLHIEEDGSFSIAAAVCDVGQVTPIHDHGTWGVTAIYQGIEREERFRPPFDGPPKCDQEWEAEEGEVFVCCTSDEDIHRVSCGSDVPCVGIHVYGADIGAIERRIYDVKTGKVKTFVSGWG